MLFECKTIHNGEHKTYLVQANNFSGAEAAFNDFAAQTLNGEFSLNSINKSECQLAVTGNMANPASLNSKTEHNRIGFNIDALKRQVRTTYSHKVIIFD